MSGLYVHIPFCKAKCHYCDFSAFAGQEKWIDSYLTHLKKEMEAASGTFFSSIFIGGGTPTLLEPRHLEDLLPFIQRSFKIYPEAEFTIESNPETMTLEKAWVLREGGINRISFGLQTTEERLLGLIGRTHDLSTFYRAYEIARGAGFSNINVDLIYGFPTQTFESWKNTVEDILKLNPEHISAYALTVEEGTVFGRQRVSVDPDLQAQMYLWVHERLTSSGYSHYEISNFAKPGRECRHNLLYWEDGDYLGVGCSAASSLSGVRRQNDPTLDGYLHRMERDRTAAVNREQLEGIPKILERLILRLRLARGVRLPFPKQELFDSTLQKFTEYGFLEADERRLIPTVRGWLLSNQLFTNLMLAAE